MHVGAEVAAVEGAAQCGRIYNRHRQREGGGKLLGGLYGEVVDEVICSLAEITRVGEYGRVCRCGKGHGLARYVAEVELPEHEAAEIVAVETYAQQPVVLDVRGEREVVKCQGFAAGQRGLCR